MSYNEIKQHGTLDFPIELYHIDKKNSKFEMTSHWHKEIEIIRIITGELNVKLNNKEYIARKNDIVFINCETVHSAIPKDDRCIYECLVMNVEFLLNGNTSCSYFVENLTNHEYMVRETFSKENEDFSNIINFLFNVMDNKSSGYKFTVIGYLYQLFGIIVDNHYYSGISNLNDNKNIPKLKKVLRFIRNNYDSPISLADMANAAGMSPKYFCAFFKDMTRKTPIEYLNSYRIEKASRKLLNSDASITDIAFSCGFNDLSYFIKTFKTINGITPRKYRKG